jgi:hypothetical protein
MLSKPGRILVTILLWALSFCLLSCAGKQYSLKAPRDFQMSATAKENKIPFRAALYTQPVSKVTQGWGTIDLEEAFSDGCERMLKNIFREVILIKYTENHKYDVMVKPEIIKWERESLSTKFWINMDVVWNIYSPRGKTILSNIVKSGVESKVSAVSTFETKVNEIMAGYVAALNDQLLKAQDEIHSGKWWNSQW